ncbi:unnamed protein product, partial [Staurois parvus]
QKEQSKCRQGTGQSTRDKIKKKDIFLKFSNFPPYVPTSQGPEHRSRMPASSRRRWPGRCRGHIVGAQDKVSAAGNP